MISITEPFIRRPVMTTLVMLSILLFGILGYRALAVSELPNVDYPTIEVGASLPGASPETVASAIATPLEKQFSTIAGIDSMTSSSSLGGTSITLQFDLSRNIDGAAQDVQAAISRASSQLPPNMPTPPTYNKVNPADQPILYIAMGSKTLPPYTVDRYAETLMGQRISMVKGVAQVQVYGSQKYAVRIQLDPQALATRQIGVDEVHTAVQNGNVNMPVGTLYGDHRAFTLQANGQLTHASVYRTLIVAYRNGSPVRLEDVGKVVRQRPGQSRSELVERHRIRGAGHRAPAGTNTVEVVDAVKQLLPQFRAIIPPSIHMQTLYDASESIRNSVADVKFTLFLAVALVIMVIFLFLRNLSATLIPSFALPMSIIGTFAVMYVLGYTIDNLSLMALTLSVGFVVDDAIVMLENIVRHMEMGEGVMEAALAGSREIGFTILSMTVSLAAVFLPVFLMGGIMGRLLHEFAVVIITAILVSGFVSLTLTPMLCSRFLRPVAEQKHGRVYMSLERFFDRLLHYYDVSLQWALRHRVFVMTVSGVILVITVWQFMVIPKGFLPPEDRSQIFISTEAQQGISFDSMRAHQLELNKIALADPNVRDFFSGVGDFSSSNAGIMFLHLKDRPQRPPIPNPTLTALATKYANVPLLGSSLRAVAPLFAHHPTIDEVIEELGAKFTTVTGMNAYMQNLPPIQVGAAIF